MLRFELQLFFIQISLSKIQCRIRLLYFLSSILLHHDAPVDCEDNKCRTPLFYATKSGTKSSIVLLKENGAEINHTDMKGKTPIFKARNYNTTNLLLYYGVSIYMLILIQLFY